MKKWMIFLIIFTLLLPVGAVFADAAFTSALETKANVVYMISLDDEKTIIYDKNSEQKTSPSAVAKIVTAMVVLEACDDYSLLLTAPYDPVRSLDALGCTTVGILVGEKISVQELLYCMMINNACDAANILANHFGGNSIDAFVEKMNAFAADAGCTDTHFTNPNGFDDPAQHTTARDIAVLYKKCLQNDFFTELAGMKYYDMPATNLYKEVRYLRTTNLCMNAAFAEYYCEYIVNGKGGTTEADRSCLVTTGSKDGYTYLCVVLDAPNEDSDGDGYKETFAMTETKALYEWTFRYVKLRVVAKTSTIVSEARVNLASEFDYVSLVPKEEISALVPEGVDAESVYIEAIPELTKTEVDAPVYKGDVLGVASIKYAGEEIVRVDLVASFDVERSHAKFIGDSILAVVTSKLFLALVALAVFVVLPLLVVFFVVLPSRRQESIRIVKGYEALEDKKKKNTNKRR